MQEIVYLNAVARTAPAVEDAARIPRLWHDEAELRATMELKLFLDVLEALDEADWHKPTACTAWNVKDIAAHQAGSLNGTTSFGNLRRLRSKALIASYLNAGMSMLDASNQAQVDMRKDRSPEALVAEIREQGPRAIAFRKRLPSILRAIRISDPELGGAAAIGYMTDTIFTRDMWIHRLDICRATKREFVQTAYHDGRIIALIVCDLASLLPPHLGEESVVFALSGIAGGEWRIGAQPTPGAIIKMGVLDFNLLASGRLTSDELRSYSLVTIVGDQALGNRALEHTRVPY